MTTRPHGRQSLPRARRRIPRRARTPCSVLYEHSCGRACYNKQDRHTSGRPHPPREEDTAAGEAPWGLSSRRLRESRATAPLRGAPALCAPLLPRASRRSYQGLLRPSLSFPRFAAPRAAPAGRRRALKSRARGARNFGPWPGSRGTGTRASSDSSALFPRRRRPRSLH